jgi:hypothetical protein
VTASEASKPPSSDLDQTHVSERTSPVAPCPLRWRDGEVDALVQKGILRRERRETHGGRRTCSSRGMVGGLATSPARCPQLVAIIEVCATLPRASWVACWSTLRNGCALRATGITLVRGPRRRPAEDHAVRRARELRDDADPPARGREPFGRLRRRLPCPTRRPARQADPSQSGFGQSFGFRLPAFIADAKNKAIQVELTGIETGRSVRLAPYSRRLASTRPYAS